MIYKGQIASRHWMQLVLFFLLLLLSSVVRSQTTAKKNTPDTAQAEAPKDTLGRTTPRGTVFGFVSATRKGNAEIAALYLNTPLRGADAVLLGRQLAVVLDRRLPARLNQISDLPEGSRPDPLMPDEDVIGTISTAEGSLDIVVERVDRGKAGKVWLFSRKTLAVIPEVFQEVSTPSLEDFLPKFLVRTTIASIPLFEWLALFVGLPVLYVLTGLLDQLIARSLGALRRRLRQNVALKNPHILPVPLRLLLLAIIVRIVSASVPLPLLARQFWSTATLFIALLASIWWLFLLNSSAERYVLKRRPAMSGSASVLRLLRRLLDGIVLFAGLLFMLYHFGINVTAALAGLGVGGIAVALAAQKTLENVIGGVSLIADQAVRVGDFLNVDSVQGTVEEVGLRSTRIRTLDRTVVILPNGQIANMRLETTSARDKFWFHPVIRLSYETTPHQLRLVLANISELLRQNAKVDPSSVRVRFFRLGSFSLDIDLFAYVATSDWSGFLEIQETLLIGIMEIIEKAGTEIASPPRRTWPAEHQAQMNPQPPIRNNAQDVERVA